MIKASYEQLVQKIAGSTGLDSAEINRRIDAKRAKLSDLISKEGAAQIVAAELGISFDKQKVKVNELLIGMRKITLIAKVLKIFPIRAFKTKTADSKVASMLLGDETGTVRCVLWDASHIKLLEDHQIIEGSVVEIKDSSVRGTDAKELHLGSFSSIKLSDEEIENVVTSEAIFSKSISDVKINDRVRLRATIIQIFDPKFFLVCKECKKKVTLANDKYTCQTHGQIMPEERALLNMMLDDGVSNIRAVCFSDALKKLFLEGDDLKNPDLFIVKKQDLLGKEFFFSGKIRLNKVFNTNEFTVQDIEEVNLDQLINELSK